MGRAAAGSLDVAGALASREAGIGVVALELSSGAVLDECLIQRPLRSPPLGLMPANDDAFDNALPETINGLYKAECIRTTVFHDGPYKTTRPSPTRTGT